MGYKPLSRSRKKRLRKSKKNHSKVVGLLQKSKNNRFRVKVLSREKTYKISVRELKKAFIGDKVLCSLSPIGWAIIEKVLESNTYRFIGRIEKFGKSYKASPLDSGKYNYVNIIGKLPKNLKPSSLAKIKVTEQPTISSPAKGYIEQILDESNSESKANEIAISRFNLRTTWSRNIINELKKIKKLDSFSSGLRKDLSHLAFVTIDGKDAKDFDDAVFAEKNKKGNFNLYVAIADVSHYVKVGSYIDQEARKRGTSIYFTNQVLPMLPEEISNELCSLNPDERKVCLVCKAEIDKNGTLMEAVFFEGIIESKERLTYEETNKFFEKKEYPEHLANSLRSLKEIYDLLKVKKISRYALELIIPDYIPKIQNGKIEKFVKTKRNTAHKVIEECMLLANISAAKILSKSKLPSIYRIHPKPDILSINQLQAFVRSRSINIKIRPEGLVEDFSNLIELVADRKDREAIHMQILQSLNLAIYSAKLSEHFALSYSAYTHFTSPIRRYPDLMVHRAIKGLLSQNQSGKLKINEIKKTNLNVKKYPFKLEEIKKIADLSSTKEREAEGASRNALNTLKCELALKHRQKSFQGNISGITNFGIFIHITDLGIEGLCHIKNLPKHDYYLFDEDSKSLIGKSSGQGYYLGDPVSARIKNVDVLLNRIDLDITR